MLAFTHEGTLCIVLLSHLVVLWVLLSAVRVAEWSKAPDSRAILPASQVLSLLVHVCGRGFESHL